MGKQHNRRVFAGYYRRYDGQRIYVITVTRDIDTGEVVVVCKYATYSENAEYFTITKQSFCEMVEQDGTYVDKFTRQTQYKVSQIQIGNLKSDGFDGPKRKKPVSTPDEYDFRIYRSAGTYLDYAKNLCENYLLDARKYKLCVQMKRYIGVSGKEEFLALKEDIAFLQDCLKTVLKDYSDFFKERFIDRLSIRKYAAAHSMNRGSVDYLQKKFVAALAAALKERDAADSICRLKKRE